MYTLRLVAVGSVYTPVPGVHDALDGHRVAGGVRARLARSVSAAVPAATSALERGLSCAAPLKMPSSPMTS